MGTESEVPISAWDSGILMSSNWQLALSFPGLFQASRLQGDLPSEMCKDSIAYDVYEAMRGPTQQSTEGIELDVQALADPRVI